jgi:hypothetical protein
MRLRSVLLLIVISTSVTACWSRARPNVLLIVIDTLRADRLGCYGNPLGLTPFMDGLAKRGVVFENAYAASSWTSPSVASLFTSRYPTQHQVVRHDTKLSQDETTLAEKLKTASYFSGGFSANLLVGPAMGFGQGFDMYRYIAPTKTEGIKTRAPRLQSKALKWLEDATLELRYSSCRRTGRTSSRCSRSMSSSARTYEGLAMSARTRSSASGSSRGDLGRDTGILRRYVKSPAYPGYPQTLPSDCPLTRVIDRMVETRWRSFPVVDGERLVGVISRSDVLSALRRAAAGQRPT